MADARPVIAHVLHRLDRAGAEVLAAGIARSLKETYHFTFICLDALGPMAKGLTDEGFTCVQMSRQPGIDRKLARSLQEVLANERVDLIHAHQYTPFFYTALSRGVFRSHHNTPILFTEHGRHYPDRRSLKRAFANKRLLGRRDRVTAVGRYVRDALIVNESIPDHRIEVILNGIDPGPEPTDADRAAAREQLGIDGHRPVAMQVARFHKVKDHETAIRAWTRVHQALPDALLVLVGDGAERPGIEAMAGRHGLADAVRFTGAVDDARKLIPAADVCLLTSLSEGISVTLLEAMAAGKPIVATDVGGNAEVVEHDTTGVLVPRGADKELAARLTPLLANAAYAQRDYGQAGRARLLEYFTADRMHAAYADLYARMLNG